MLPGQDLYHVTSAVLSGMRDVFVRARPDWVLVQGDTTTTFAAALAATYEHIAVGHVEAGLRTGNRSDPFPEEINRMMTTCLAGFHFAPTPDAADNLRREGCSEGDIVVTGNTVIDALYHTLERCRDHEYPELGIDDGKILLITVHRRENFGEGVRGICVAVAKFARARPDWQIVWPVHPNPQIKEIVYATLSEIENIRLVDPLRYDAFVHILGKSRLVLTDSGGVLEEAVSIGKFVLVARRHTERMEAVNDEAAILVDPVEEAIGKGLETAVTTESWRQGTTGGWYGDGKAAIRIRDALLQKAGL